MITLGTYSFPEDSTILQINEIEAKSKVRKEIRIQSLLSHHNYTALQNGLYAMQAALEAFDRQEVSLSLAAGRYFNGRKRHFKLIPCPNESLAWIDLLILTSDRYERSTILHSHESDTYAGQTIFPVFNMGNWLAPFQLSILPLQDLSKVTIQVDQVDLSIVADIPASQSLLVDTENRQVLLEGSNIYASANETFPVLQSGSNHVKVSIEPTEASAHCLIHFRDYWI